MKILLFSLSIIIFTLFSSMLAGLFLFIPASLIAVLKIFSPYIVHGILLPSLIQILAPILSLYFAKWMSKKFFKENAFKPFHYSGIAIILFSVIVFSYEIFHTYSSSDPFIMMLREGPMIKSSLLGTPIISIGLSSFLFMKMRKSQKLANLTNGEITNEH